MRADLRLRVDRHLTGLLERQQEREQRRGILRIRARNYYQEVKTGDIPKGSPLRRGKNEKVMNKTT